MDQPEEHALKKGIWNDFIRKTEKLSRPVMQKGIIPDHLMLNYQALLGEVLMAFSRKNDPYNGLKVFVNGVQDNLLNEQLIAHPPESSESLDHWGERSFAGKPYGLVMNALEQYSNKLVQEVSTLVTPLLEEAGWPAMGLSMLFFMGNYGYTPFGVHQDAPGEDGFLFHLGPGRKKLYTWDTETYNRITNHAPSFKRVAELLPYGTLHELEPGDVMFIPSEVFHVADSPEFSVSLVLDYRRPSRERFSKLLLERLEFEESGRQYIAPVRVQQDINARMADCSLDRELIQAWQHLHLALMSNGGFYQPSIRCAPNWDASPFYLKRPFRIMTVSRQNALIVYARGHRIVCARSGPLQKVIDELNAGNPSSIDSLLHKLSDAWEASEVYAFFARLVQTDIIDFGKVKKDDGP